MWTRSPNAAQLDLLNGEQSMNLNWFKSLPIGFAVLGMGVSFAGTSATPKATPVPLYLSVVGNVQLRGSESRAAPLK